MLRKKAASIADARNIIVISEAVFWQ